jgi:molecular chaperone HscA
VARRPLAPPPAQTTLHFLVGAPAKRAAPANPANSYGSVKRLLGRPYRALPRPELARLGFGVVEAFDGGAGLWCPARGEALTPVDVCGVLLASLASRAAEAAGGPLGGAVVTVPARFTPPQLAAVRAAAAAAGLGDDVRLLHEPVAAAIAHGVGRVVEQADGSRPPPSDDVALVVDLGGGTLDVAIVDCFEGMMEVVGAAGDPRLGGDDFDAALADWLASQHPVAAALAAAGGRSPAARVRLLAAAEAAKIALTDAADTAVELRVVDRGPPVRVALSRTRFDEVTAALVDRLWPVLRAAAAEAGVVLACDRGEAETSAPAPSPSYAPPPRTITRAILVGGGTRVPAVVAAVERAAGVPPSSGVDPEAAVALGAAALAGALAGAGGAFELADGAYAPDLHGRASGFGAAAGAG